MIHYRLAVQPIARSFNSNSFAPDNNVSRLIEQSHILHVPERILGFLATPPHSCIDSTRFGHGLRIKHHYNVLRLSYHTILAESNAHTRTCRFGRPLTFDQLKRVLRARSYCRNEQVQLCKFRQATYFGCNPRGID